MERAGSGNLREGARNRQSRQGLSFGRGIVGEVFVGLLEGDPMSYLRQDPDWTPTLSDDDEFSIVDLLNFAGVVTAM